MPPSASSALQATWASGRRDAARLSGGRGAGGQRALPLTDPTHFPSVLHCGLSWGPHPPRRPEVGVRQQGRAAESPWSPGGPCADGETEARAIAGPQLATYLSCPDPTRPCHILAGIPPHPCRLGGPLSSLGPWGAGSGRCRDPCRTYFLALPLSCPESGALSSEGPRHRPGSSPRPLGPCHGGAPHPHPRPACVPWCVCLRRLCVCLPAMPASLLGPYLMGLLHPL